MNKNQTITESEIIDFPGIVQKWLKKTGVLGKKKIKTVSFSQTGKMKLKPDQKKWFKPQAKQYVRVDKPGYLWHVDLPIFPIINTKGKDLFYNGKGSMKIKLGSLINLVNVENNKKVDESSLHRFLLEMPWYPTAALEKYVKWEEIDDYSARCKISYEGLNVSADFHFDKEGNLLRLECLRYKENNAQAKRIPCIGNVKGYTEVEGIKIPNKIDVSWEIDGEIFTWYKIEIYDISFSF